ncbi:MAG: hypothetical protein JWR14_256 [Caballeronia sp.]|jgi:hypothetical protein|uniref:zinc ribbon domain-containing protein n=1 Tax=Caballeronia sp. TaxID=1931223 RepID=UPI002632B28E|nr:hypothetical protein [Caballeronia sp.]MDB5830426.1 hypothetical protein [Caballeronia sp.]
MARLFFPTSADSVTCKRCGNDIPSDADTCPHCGADHGPGFGAAKTAALTTGLRLPFGPRREALNIPSPYPSVPEESELAGTGEQRWDMSKTITLGAVALALVAGGVIYSQHGSNSGDDTTRSELPAGHSAYGAIDMKTAHDAPARSAAPTPAVPPARSAAGAAGTGTGTATTSRQAQTAAAPSVAAREALPTDTSSARAATALAGATDNLQAARDAITRGDLTTARRRFSKIPVSQLGAANVQRTQADLTGLEHARDEMLQVARGCEATGSWLCVRQNARDVLTIDASNVEAQSLVERAIARSGWLNKPAPATTAAHGARHNNAQTAAVAPAAPAPIFVPGPRVAATLPLASTHKPTITVSAAEHARAVAAMGVPTPISTPVAAAPVAPTVVTTMRTPVTAQAVPGTGSQAPLTSSPTTSPQPLQQAAPTRPPVSPVPAFVPMPDGPDAMPATAPVRSSPATATARAPAQPEPEPAAAAQVPGDTASPPVMRQLAPVSEAVPVRAGIVSPPVAANGAPAGVQNITRSPSPTVHRTLASGDNATSAAQPHAPAFNTTNPDDEERAILESGWSKRQSSAHRSTPQ